MVVFDTQVTSEHLRAGGVPDGVAVTSTTLQEIFGMQGAGNTRNRFYLPLMKDEYQLHHYAHLHAERKGDRRRIRPHTDRLIINFAADHPTVVEYSHSATCRLLELSRRRLDAGFQVFAAHARPALTKATFANVRTHYRSLSASSARYVALATETVDVALSLLPRFTREYNLKNDFRNSLNDLLILATAIRMNETLHTRDQVLSDFAVTVAQAEVSSRTDGRFEVSFRDPSAVRRVNSESKGYINLGWRVHRR